MKSFTNWFINEALLPILGLIFLAAVIFSILWLTGWAATKFLPTQPQQTVIPSKAIQVSYEIYRYHDDENGATCWLYANRGISCISDKDLRR